MIQHMSNDVSLSQEMKLRVTGMDCANCARTVESGVARLDGVDQCALTFTTEVLRVTGAVDRGDVVARVEALGYGVADSAESAGAFDPSQRGTTDTGRDSFWRYMWRRRDTRAALLAALLVLPGLVLHELLPGLGIHHPLIDLTSIVAMVLAGVPVARSAWRALRINHQISINLLMTVAAVGAVVIGAYTEAAVVMVLFVFGEAMEGFSADKARHSIRSLMSVVPQEATVLRPCIDCAGHMGQDGYTGGPCPWCGLEAQRVPVADLQLGETIVIKPGERIPMDGTVADGYSSVNQAPITGESRLIDKAPGDEVFAGSINHIGALEVSITHVAEDNTISRMVRMVAEAQERRAPVQRFVDRFAHYYTPAVMVLALLVAAIPPLLFGQPFLNPDAATQGWLYRGLTLLVIACPCALVISTPVSIVSAISNGARHGVLFKGGVYVETLARVKAIAFDKTGTLTRGKPVVAQVKAVSCVSAENDACDDECDACDDVLALASAVEQRSEHPLAHAIVTAATARGVDRAYGTAADVTALTGRGVSGAIDGHLITVGSHAYFDETVPHALHCDVVASADEQGFTTMLVSEDDTYRGFIAVTDEVRGSSTTAVAALQRLGIGRLVMLTGDNPQTAQRVADQVGVTEFRASCLPEEKVEAVAALREEAGTVAMVGDGINDTPALATASVGIAIGNTAQAMESADVVLMRDSLLPLPFALRLSRAAMRTVQANVAFSIGIKLVFLLLVLFGWGTMWMAVLADVGASLLVTLNGMRLLRRPIPADTARDDPTGG